jgi:hypothetical protein
MKRMNRDILKVDKCLGTQRRLRLEKVQQVLPAPPGSIVRHSGSNPTHSTHALIDESQMNAPPLLLVLHKDGTSLLILGILSSLDRRLALRFHWLLMFNA